MRLTIEAFEPLTGQDRTLFEQAALDGVKEAAPRRDVVREGERPRAVQLILGGWACRYKQLPDGRRQVVGFHIPGDLCGTNVFVSHEMDHTLAAVTRLRFAEIGMAEIQAMVRQSPRIARALWWNALVGAAVAREWVLNVGQRTAYERIAHLICEMYVRLDFAGQVVDRLCDWPLTQGDLACATGLTAVHVNRTLQELRRAGLLELGNRQLFVPDFARLQRAATFNPNYLHMTGRRDGEPTPAEAGGTLAG